MGISPFKSPSSKDSEHIGAQSDKVRENLESAIKNSAVTGAVTDAVKDVTSKEVTIGKRQMKVSQIGFVAITILMLIVFFVSIGSNVRKPWPLALELESLSTVCATEESIALIDDRKTRLSIVDSNGEIANIVNVSSNKTSGEEFNIVYTNGENMYYSVSVGDTDTAYLASERVYSSKLYGGSKTLLYEQTYTAADTLISPTFNQIFEYNDDVLLLRVTTQGDALELISLVQGNGVIATKQLPEYIAEIRFIEFDFSRHNVAIIDNLGKLYVATMQAEDAKNESSDFEQITVDGTMAFADCTWGSDGYLYCIDALAQTLVRIDPQTEIAQSYPDKSGYATISSSSDKSFILGGLSDSYDIFRVEDFAQSTALQPFESITSIPFSLALSATIVAFWIALIYLVVCIVVILVRIILNMRKNGQINELVRGVLVAGCALLLVGVTAFFFNQFYAFTEKTRHDTVAALCQTTATQIENAIKNKEAQLENGNALINLSFEELQNLLGKNAQEQCVSFADNNIGLNVTFAAWSDQKMMGVIVDAQRYDANTIVAGNVPGDKPSIKSLASQAAGTTVQSRWQGDLYDFLLAYHGIENSAGDVVGFVLYSCNVADLTESYTSICVDLVMTLLAALGAIVLVLLEGKGFVEAFRLRRQEKARQGGMPEIWSMRPLVFFILMASCFDASLNVLITQDMLVAMGVENTELLVGIPVAAMTFGGFLGNLLFGFLSEKMDGRKMFALSMLVACICLIASYFTVAANAFWLFCLTKFFTGISLYCASSLAYAMPLCTNDETARTKLFQDSTMAALSGSALGGLICGYAVQYLGNSWIYAVNAIPVFIGLIVGLKMLPAGLSFASKDRGSANAGASETSKQKSRAMLRAFLSPSLLSLLICITFPLLLTNGYKSIFFPLFMADGGISKTNINNLVVLSNIAIFVLSPQITRATKNYDQWIVVIAATLFSGVVMAWFMINSTFVWSILALVLLGASSKICIPGRKLLLPREARHRGLSETKTNNTFGVLESLVDTFRSPVLSSLTALGQSLACLVVGAFCVAGASIFALVTARAPIRGKRATTEDTQANSL